VSIAFPPQRWDRVKETYRRFWADRLDRPIVPVELSGRDPGRPQPQAPLLTQATCADLTIPVADLVDRIDWELSRLHYLGDAYPVFNLDCFGPGVLAAFVGARLDNSTGRVWFHPPKPTPITDLHLAYDPDNPYLRRVIDLCAEMMRRWQGQVLVGMPDLGGNLDVLSTFRPGEQLLLDLYDHPDDVLRVLAEEHELWHHFYAQINAVLQPHNPGYTAWCKIYSDQPYYMLQCDFAYMIGPEMFAKFVAPELTRTVQRLGRAFYHLDGVGQLPHLDQVLAIPGLGGVQWVPGDGHPGCAHWPEVYQRIVAAGKRTQIWGGIKSLDAVIAQTAAPGRIHHPPVRMAPTDQPDAHNLLRHFGVEP
jgi:5-methyltetrahydrofolate--homocysteine methyltransferase